MDRDGWTVEFSACPSRLNNTQTRSAAPHVHVSLAPTWTPICRLISRPRFGRRPASRHPSRLPSRGVRRRDSGLAARNPRCAAKTGIRGCSPCVHRGFAALQSLQLGYSAAVGRVLEASVGLFNGGTKSASSNHESNHLPWESEHRVPLISPTKKFVLFWRNAAIIKKRSIRTRAAERRGDFC